MGNIVQQTYSSAKDCQSDMQLSLVLNLENIKKKQVAPYAIRVASSFICAGGFWPMAIQVARLRIHFFWLRCSVVTSSAFFAPSCLQKESLMFEASAWARYWLVETVSAQRTTLLESSNQFKQGTMTQICMKVQTKKNPQSCVLLTFMQNQGFDCILCTNRLNLSNKATFTVKLPPFAATFCIVVATALHQNSKGRSVVYKMNGRLIVLTSKGIQSKGEHR